MSSLTKRQESRSLSTPFGSWEPFRVMREMFRWDPFRDFGSSLSWEPVGFAPSFDVKETKEAFVLQADLPGVQEKDLSLALTGNRLTVSGKREAEGEKEDENYYSVERSYGSFTRAFALPEGVDAEKVHAELKEGVLTLMLPKKPEVKAKQIPVRSGK